MESNQGDNRKYNPVKYYISKRMIIDFHETFDQEEKPIALINFFCRYWSKINFNNSWITNKIFQKIAFFMKNIGFQTAHSTEHAIQQLVN